MNNIEIKSIESYLENEVSKTKMIISDKESEREIILEGKGSLKVPVEA